MSNSTELWKPLYGFEELYEVSTFGAVRSIPRIALKNNSTYQVNGKILTPYFNESGYLMVALYKNGKKFNSLIHRLVALTFLPHNTMPHVNHIDCDRLNNKLSNLEWTTPKLKMAHSRKLGRLKDQIPPIVVAEVIKLRKKGWSINHISRRLGISKASVVKYTS